jgi:membrane protein DedA with SNARE-associated domain
MRTNPRLLNTLRVVILVGVITLTIFLFTLSDEEVKKLEAFGYPGIFLISIIANATILIPAPGVALVFSFGARFNPLWVALASGAGAALGELSGYLAGFSGQAIIERADIYEKFSRWMEKHGYLTVLVLSFIPNPLFDLAGMTAGALKMRVGEFLVWCFLGKLLKMAIFAFAGAYSWDWLSPG